MKRLPVLLFLLLFAACGPSSAKLAARSARFWDGTDFTNPALTAQADDLDKRFARYVALLEDKRMPMTISGPLLQGFITQAEGNADIFYMCWELCEKYLYAPDSPCRNEELYGYALQTVVASNCIGDYHKIRPRYQLNMIARNRVGGSATDFAFTLPCGERSTLYAANAEYTVLYFYNPDCDACDALSAELAGQRFIRRLEAEGRLRIIALYSDPDEDEALWRASLSKYPSDWLMAYDDGAQIHYRGLYDLRQIPCLYLLDARKRVLCKGATSVEQLVQALKTAGNGR